MSPFSLTLVISNTLTFFITLLRPMNTLESTLSIQMRQRFVKWNFYGALKD